MTETEVYAILGLPGDYKTGPRKEWTTPTDYFTGRDGSGYEVNSYTRGNGDTWETPSVHYLVSHAKDFRDTWT
jgi:hypothetical protein